MIASRIIGRLTKTSAIPPGSSRSLFETKEVQVQVEREEGGEEKKLDMAEQNKMVEEAAPKARNHGLAADKNNERHQPPPREAEQYIIQALPDMTGKIITVSAEETFKLTKDKDKEHTKKGNKRRNGDSKKKIPVQEITDPSNSDMELMADVGREFEEFIATLSTTKIKGDNGVILNQSLAEDVKPSSINSETNEAIRRKSACMSEYEQDAILGNIDDEARRKLEYTNTVDYTVDDTWGSTKQKSETATLVDTSIADVSVILVSAISESEFDSAPIYAKNSNDTNNGKSGAGARIKSRRAQQPFHSSLRRCSSIEDNGKQKSDRVGGISWASLITMDSERKEKKKGISNNSKYATTSRSRRSRDGEKNQLSTSYLSNESKVSSSSRNTKGSLYSRNSHGSKRSNCSKHSHDMSNNNNNNSVSWKNESSLTQASTYSNKDPEHIRKQAKERFERGLHYAKRGKYTVARERFLMALRYRVMHRGPTHVDAAAVHEMLGHVHYFLSQEEEVMTEDDFEASLRLKDGGGEVSGGMLGWDVTVLENDKSKRRDKVHLEKAAMHYRTVLDIFKANQGVLNGSKQAVVNSLTSNVVVPENDRFKWSDVAKTYNGLEGHGDDNEDASRLASEIVARVQRKLASLPIAGTDGKSKSYVTSFVDS